MSDHKSTYGEPVEDTTPVDDTTHVDDVVGSAHAGLADAEAARSAVDETPGDDTVRFSDASASEPVADALVDGDSTSPHDHSARDSSRDVAQPAFATPVEPVESAEPIVAVPATDRARDDADTVVTPASDSGDLSFDESAYITSAAVAAPAAVASPAPQPIFVQAPEMPRPRGNRAAAGAIGLLAAVVFAILYLGAWLALGTLDGTVTAQNVGETVVSTFGTWAFWVPVVVFYISFWLLGAIINRGRWGIWVIFGLLVGAASYGGHILGQLFQAPFWMLTATAGQELIESQLLAPLAIVAFVLGREITIWFGAWVAARGRKVTELNIEAQREYERTLEAGPQLVRA
ncbi:ABC transporter [Microbacterium sp. P01]|uniref:ABC transporter n=1 Tax=Microbacterium sp. P01 TaxID=3366261 RepID=UPI003670C69E